MTQSSISIGFNARLFPANWRPARLEVAFAQHVGFDCLSFRGREDGQFERYFDDTPETIGSYLRQANLQAVMEIVIRVDPYGRTEHGLTPEQIFELNLPAISALGITHVHMHFSRATKYDPLKVQQAEQHLIELLTQTVQRAQYYGVTLGFEHNATGPGLFSSFAACQQALAHVDDLQFVWDLNHTSLAEQPLYLAISDRIMLLHVSDTPLPDLNHHQPLGRGSLNLQELFAQLHTARFSGPAILEIGGQPFSGGFGQDTDQTLTDSLHYLRQLLNQP